MGRYRLLLSSFGFCANLVHKAFYGVPPVVLESGGRTFLPDYPVFFLYDEFVIDIRCMERLRSPRLSPRLKPVADAVEALERTGRLRQVDYTNEIAPALPQIGHEVEETLDDVLHVRAEILQMDELWQKWVSSLSELAQPDAPVGRETFETTLTRELTADPRYIMPGMNRTFRSIIERWHTKRITRVEREFARDWLRQFFWHARAHAALGEKMGAAVHDWSNLHPLYHALARASAPSDSALHGRARELFTAVFPGVHARSARALTKALTHRDLPELRHLVQRAAAGEVKFDQKFVTDVYSDAMAIRAEEAPSRRLVGWSSDAISLGVESLSGLGGVGPFVGRTATELLEVFTRSKNRRKMPWYYVVVDAFDRPSAKR